MNCMGIISKPAYYRLERGYTDVGRWDAEPECFDVHVSIDGTECMIIRYSWDSDGLTIKARNVVDELLRNTCDFELVSKVTAWIVKEFDDMGDMELWPDVFWTWEDSQAVEEKFPVITI